MGNDRQVEIERKYDVDNDVAEPEFLVVDGVAHADEPVEANLDATYFDTAGLAFARAHIALRRRSGGVDEGWHIKLPGDEGRVELHWPLTDETSVPERIRDAAGVDIGSEPLVPVARVTNRRLTTLLRGASGAVLAEFCDDHVDSENLRTGLRRSWREWEIELHDGAPSTREGRTAFLDQLEQHVRAAGGEPSVSSSKLARALGIDDLH